MNGINVYKRDPRDIPVPSATWGYSEKMPTNQDVGPPHQTLNLPAPWSWTSHPPEVGEINFWVYKPPSLWYFSYSTLNRLRKYSNIKTQLFPLIVIMNKSQPKLWLWLFQYYIYCNTFNLPGFKHLLVFCWTLSHLWSKIDLPLYHVAALILCRLTSHLYFRSDTVVKLGWKISINYTFVWSKWFDVHVAPLEGSEQFKRTR